MPDNRTNLERMGFYGSPRKPHNFAEMKRQTNCDHDWGAWLWDSTLERYASDCSQCGKVRQTLEP